MRIAYVFSSYLYFQHLTSPPAEWVNRQMLEHGVDMNAYDDWSTAKITIWILLLIGIVIAELKSHRFYIAQTSEETKYPFKPQRILITFWIWLGLIWSYPSSRFMHFLFICSIQRVVINHLCIVQVRMLSARSLMLFAIPYWFGAIFRIIVFWYVVYMIVLLVASCIIQGIKEHYFWKLLCAALYIISGGFYFIAISKGSETSMLISLGSYVLVTFIFLKPYYDFMKPHLKANEEIWKNRAYNLWK